MGNAGSHTSIRVQTPRLVDSTSRSHRFYLLPPLSFGHRRLKKSRIRSATGSDAVPACLPPAFISIATAPAPPRPAPPRPHRRGVLAARGRITQLLLSPPTWAPHARYRRGLHMRLSAAILLHHDRTIRMLRPPDCHVLLKAHVASVCFECFQMF
jgi:hypothetical protein